MTDDGTYEYYYDCENRLTDVNESGSNVVTYTYDYLGRRVSKTVDGNTTKYFYDGDRVIEEYDVNDTRLRRYFYGPSIDEPISMIDYTDGSKMYYYHFDPLGSVAALSDTNGMLVERYEYDVYGKPTMYDANDNVIFESSVGNPYMFTGRRYDTETGLYYYRARYCAPNIGRFLQPDPIGYRAGLNLYTYATNNPVNRVDPLGLDVIYPPYSLRSVCDKYKVGMSKGCCGNCKSLAQCYREAGDVELEYTYEITLYILANAWHPWAPVVCDEYQEYILCDIKPAKGMSCFSLAAGIEEGGWLSDYNAFVGVFHACKKNRRQGTKSDATMDPFHIINILGNPYIQPPRASIRAWTNEAEYCRSQGR